MAVEMMIDEDYNIRFYCDECDREFLTDDPDLAYGHDCEVE